MVDVADGCAQALAPAVWWGMPLRHEIRAGVLRLVLDGDYEQAALESAVSEALADPAYRAGMSLLIDSRRTGGDGSSAALRERVRFLRSTREHFSGKCALVVTGLLRFGLARMFASLAEVEGIEVRVFQDMDEAEAWIGWFDAEG